MPVYTSNLEIWCWNMVVGHGHDNNVKSIFQIIKVNDHGHDNNVKSIFRIIKVNARESISFVSRKTLFPDGNIEDNILNVFKHVKY